jgi:hypothetical protein
LKDSRLHIILSGAVLQQYCDHADVTGLASIVVVPRHLHTPASDDIHQCKMVTFAMLIAQAVNTAQKTMQISNAKQPVEACKDSQ